MRIRKMKRTDLPALAEMETRIFHESYPKLVLLSLEDSFKQRIAGACLVAEEGGKPVGAIFGEKISTTHPNTASIREFFVASGHRNKGIGKELMASCLAAMESQGLNNVSLFVRAKNARALKLYKEFGFKPFRLMLLRRFK